MGQAMSASKTTALEPVGQVKVVPLLCIGPTASNHLNGINAHIHWPTPVHNIFPTDRTEPIAVMHTVVNM